MSNSAEFKKLLKKIGPNDTSSFLNKHKKTIVVFGVVFLASFILLYKLKIFKKKKEGEEDGDDSEKVCLGKTFLMSLLMSSIATYFFYKKF